MKTRTLAFLAGGGALLGLAAIPAIAQPGPGGHHGGQHHGGRAGGGFALGEAFARADANNDGRVTRDEGWAWLQGWFQQMDANRDGGLTLEEAMAYRQAQRPGSGQMPARAQDRAQSMFRSLDANSDGRLTLEEIRPFAEAAFRGRDDNNDGALTREEIRPQGRGPQRQQGGPATQGAPAQPRQ